MKPIESLIKGHKTCHGKTHHESKRAAKDFATRMMKRPNTPKLYVYKCDFCTGYHLTKYEPSQYRAFARRQAEGV